MAANMKVLFIGRFQPFHKGHLRVVQEASKKYDEVIIGIGSSQYSDTSDNPFTFEERIRMIEDTLIAEDIGNYTIFAVPDINDDHRWVEHVETLVPKFDVVYTGNQKTDRLFRQKHYVVKRVEIVPNTSGTTIRNRMIGDKGWKELVPKQVSDYIDDIEGVKRVKEITS